MFDIKSLPSTGWLGWVEKTLEDQQWGSWHGKVLNTLCLRLKHGLAASAWAGCTEDIEVVSALSHVPVPPQNQQLPHVPDLTSTPSPCKLCAHCPSPQDTLGTTAHPWPPESPHLLQCPRIVLLAAEPGGAHAALLAIPAWPVGQKMDPASKQWEVTFGSSQASKINKLFKLSTDGTEEALWNRENFFF